MRPRTFFLLILVLLLGAVAVILFVLTQLGQNGLGDLPARLAPAEDVPPAVVEETDEEAPPAQPEPDPTPVIRLVPVIVAAVDLPAGQQLTAELLATELRPSDNIALVGNYAFDNKDVLVGQFLKRDVSRGQEILGGMVAMNPNELLTMGSDLSLYIDRGRVAVAFPINRYSGIAYAARPGDRVDVLMSLDFVNIDPEFRTALPNHMQRVDQLALDEGRAFLFPAEAQGRLELAPVIDLAGQVAPHGGLNAEQIPRRATQLTLQQVEVVWVGTWANPLAGFEQAFVSEPLLTPAEDETRPIANDENGVDDEEPPPERPEARPDIIILSLTIQEAMALKWAQETGVNIHLALRAQGDTSSFLTTTISLPQLEQAGLVTIRPFGDFALEPRADEAPRPELPPVPGSFNP